MSFSFQNEHPIFSLAHEGNLTTLKKVIAEDKMLAFSKASNGRCLVLFALEAGHLETVQFLLENGARLFDGISYFPAIEAAIKSGDLNIVKWLINDKKVNFSEKNEIGDTPLMIAILQGSFSIVKWLIDEKKANINVVNDNGDTPFIYACAKGHEDIARWLVDEKKVSLTQKNRKGYTALLSAAAAGSLEIIEWLTEEEDVGLQDKTRTKDNILHIAASLGHYKVVEWCMEQNLEMSPKNKLGQTPLLAAAQAGQLKILKFLIKCGCALNEKNNKEDTALMLALEHGHTDIIHWMLAKNKIDINAITKECRMLFDYAAKDVALLRLLIKRPSISYRKLLWIDTIISIDAKIKERIYKNFPWLEKIIKPSEQLLCPISLELMVTPTLIQDGYTYDEESLKIWFKHSKTSPITRQVIDEKCLIKNRFAAEAIDLFIKEAEDALKKERLLSVSTHRGSYFSLPNNIYLTDVDSNKRILQSGNRI